MYTSDFHISTNFQRKRKEWILSKRVNPQPERKLARAVLEQWLKDLDSIIKALKEANTDFVVKNLVYDLKTLWNELDFEPLRFWSCAAEVELFHLRQIFIKKIKNLLESRPDLKPFLKVFSFE